MEGHDSSGPNITTVKLIEDIKREFPNLNVVHSTLEDYAAAIKKSADEKKLKLVKGERRSAQFDRRSGNLYGYTTSARMYLKQKNFENEKWLQYYAEPFNSFSGLMGRDINEKYLDTAWELLIQNSAHDSIGGCSLDEIHDDMMNRYQHSIQIAQGVFERSVKHIVKNIDLTEYPESSSDIFLTSINPNNYSRNEIVEAVIDIPEEFDRNGFEVIDVDGKILETQIIKSSKSQPVLEEMTNRPMYLNMKRYNAFVNIKNIPPFGLKSFNIIPRSKKTEKKYSISKTVRNKIILENDHLKVSINKNGTFNLIDKLNSKSFKDLGYFYNEGEAGHAWVNEPLEPFVSTLKSTPKTKILTNGSLSSSISIKHSLKIFKDLTGRKNNSKQLVSIPIELIITLNKNSKRVDLKIEVDNKAESHRLRIMFPTGLIAKHSFGEGQFDVVKRDIKRPATKYWIEQPMYDYPMHHFVDVSDTKNGLAVLANGLKEYEVLEDKQRTLAITLFRSFEYIIQPSSKQDYSDKKGSQCLGKQIFNIAVYPHKGDWSKGKVYEEAMNYSYPIKLAQSGKADGKLNPLTSFMEIEPKEIIFSSFKKSGNNDRSFILRVYNPTNKFINGKVKFLNSIREASLVTLEEDHISKINLLSDKAFILNAEKKKIKSIELKFKGM
jgi:alpha-mannosidase